MKLISTALLKAQKQIEAVDKDGKNPFFKSDYATLNSAILACKKILNDNEIVVLQPIESDENGVYVCTTLIHTSGEQITSKHRIREAKEHDPQSQGSAITYARRYSLMSLLCMSSEDDDGEKAQAGYRKQPYNQPGKATEGQRKFITDLMRDKNITIEEVQEKIGLGEGEKMSFDQASETIEWLKSI